MLKSNLSPKGSPDVSGGGLMKRLLAKVKRARSDLSKRQKFIVASLIQSVLYLISTLIAKEVFWPTFLVSLFVVGALTLWVLWEELSDVKYFLLLILPIFFFGSQIFFIRMTGGNGFVVFFSTLFYAFGTYSLLLTQNIYNVAAIRTIQLLRAANAVGFAFTLLCAFFIFSVIWGQRPPPWILAGLVFIFSFPLILQSLWSVELEEQISKKLLGFSLILSFVAAEIALGFSFWPILPTIGALAMIVCLYVLLGLSQYYLGRRLSGKTAWEYIGVAVVVMSIILVVTKWGA